MAISKLDWILLALRTAPLDRIRLMKSLFLLWRRLGQDIPDFFTFEPYLYGPCSFELYTALADLSLKNLVVQPPHPSRARAKYYLTERGRQVADEVAAEVEKDLLALLQRIVREVSELGFVDLLRRVYSEAPEFAANSVARGIAGL